jgi:transposase InsO family protein
MRALEATIRRRCPDAGLVHHSDRGSTYASEDYRDLLAKHGIACIMSRPGNCIDNAAMESWFSTVKFELGETFPSTSRAKEQLFEYIASGASVSNLSAGVDQAHYCAAAKRVICARLRGGTWASKTRSPSSSAAFKGQLACLRYRHVAADPSKMRRTARPDRSRAGGLRV